MDGLTSVEWVITGIMETKKLVETIRAFLSNRDKSTADTKDLYKVRKDSKKEVYKPLGIIMTLAKTMTQSELEENALTIRELVNQEEEVEKKWGLKKYLGKNLIVM